MIFTLFCKTIFALKVTVMRNMKAKSFYNGSSVFNLFKHLFIFVFRIQKSCLFKFFQFPYSLFYLLSAILIRKSFAKDVNAFIGVNISYVIRYVVHSMDSAA